MREIALDTETTGLDPASGHRVVEIGCVELVNHVPSGRECHSYLNPERDMPAGAFEVHGLSVEFLADKPLFAAIVDQFMAFIEDAPLVIHNAEFDLKFLNAELARLERPILERGRTVDTLAMARRKFPGAQASLDALCRRFEIDISARDKHGALLDAQLLASVYLELSGGRQPSLGLAAGASRSAGGTGASGGGRTPRPPRPHAPSAEELAAHDAFVARLKDPVWQK
jgi:DNA polymerase-3 subunit epsilon